MLYPMKDLISAESITSRIYFICGMKVMLDRNLAELYRIETKRLKEFMPFRVQVRRNLTPPSKAFIIVL